MKQAIPSKVRYDIDKHIERDDNRIMTELDELRLFKQMVLHALNDTDDWDKLALYLESVR